jgi:hypothetical protein
MPGYDRTGPSGRGAMTGGGFGGCGPQARGANTDGRFFEKGSGRGSGRGQQRGFRRGFCFFGRGRGGAGDRADRSPETAAADPVRSGPAAEAADLRRRLEAIEQRLAGMEAPAEPRPA